MARSTHIGTSDAAQGERHAAAASGNADVQEFLDRFAQALIAGDGHTIAALWETPALVLDDYAVRAVSSPAEVEQFFSGAKAEYNSQGITDTRAEILNLHWVTPNMVSVEVRWPYIDAKGREQGDEKSTYILRRAEDGALRLRVAMMQGASAET